MIALRQVVIICSSHKLPQPQCGIQYYSENSKIAEVLAKISEYLAIDVTSGEIVRRAVDYQGMLNEKYPGYPN